MWADDVNFPLVLMKLARRAKPKTNKKHDWPAFLRPALFFMRYGILARTTFTFEAKFIFD